MKQQRTLPRRFWLTFILADLFFLLLAGYLYAGWFFSDIIIARDTRSVAEAAARSERSPESQGLPDPENISFSNEDITLRGWFFDNPQAGECGVVMLHGYSGTRYGTLQYTPLFWDRGCDLLLYDARGHGDSDPSYHTYGFYEKEDARQAVNFLTEKTGLTHDQIGFLGISYGAATVLQTAPLVPDIAFVIADSPYQDLETIVEYQAIAQYGKAINLAIPSAWLMTELRGDFEADDVSPTKAVSEAPMPVFLIHSQQDEYTLPFHSETIYANSDQDQTVLYLTDWGAAHGASIIVDPATFGGYVDSFLATYAPDFGLADGR